MKKMQLSVAEPCHENWDKMSQQDKGRFCGSCQKTVMDFTNMSDRQLAEFFKKPAVSVCGRFHQDQLNRVISTPKKRIPWLSYFFQFTWPAFVLFLKSCTNNTKTTGQVKAITQPEKKQETSSAIINQHLFRFDSLLKDFKPQFREVHSGATMGFAVVGEVALDDVDAVSKPDTIIAAVAADSSVNQVDTAAMETGEMMEPVTIVAHPLQGLVRVSRVSSGVSYCGTTVTKDTVSIEANAGDAPNQLMVYPNPAKAGQTVNLKWTAPVEGEIILYGLSGQLIKRTPIQQGENAGTAFLLPNLASGIYFLKLVDSHSGRNYSKKIIIQ